MGVFRGADSKYTEIFEVAQITSVDNSAFKCYLFDLFHLKSFVQHLDSQAQKSQRQVLPAALYFMWS